MAGLGELTPVNGVAPPIFMRFMIGFPLTRKAEDMNIVLVSTHLLGRR